MSVRSADGQARPFLTARWENLILLNFEAPPALLAPLVPHGTVLDLWNGAALISLVGFHFADTRVLGLPIFGHRNFEEVNLRFYVRRRMTGAPDRRAVVFIRELVPRAAVALSARWLYNEPYIVASMSHRASLDPDHGGEVEYSWQYRDEAFVLSAVCRGHAEPLPHQSEIEFVTEHYWGYTRQRDGGTLEYEVTHPPWSVWPSPDVRFTGPADALYGPAFGTILNGRPRSAFVADGSPVAVYPGKRLADRADTDR
jgi:uncharacterized protein YqjF (DUF2071 family)